MVKIPEGVIEGIYDLYHGRTADKDDLDDALDLDERP
jgi:hypothetical protein